MSVAARAEKRCPKCDETKLVEEFHVHRLRSDGLQAWCKLCVCRISRDHQRDLRSTSDGRDARNKYTRLLRKMSPTFQDSANEYHRRWKERNPIYRATQAARVRERQSGMVVEETVVHGIVWERDGGLCVYCGGPIAPNSGKDHRFGWSLDHVLPVSKGGVHSYANVVLSCRSCNASRGTRDVTEDWLASRRAWRERVDRAIA